MAFLQLAFGFHGRIRRRDFWLGQILLAFVVGFVAVILFPTIAATLGAPRSDIRIPTDLGWVIRALLLWPALAIAVKRGHDRNRPAAWIIALYAINVALGFFGSLADAPHPWITLVELAFLAYFVVDLGLLAGSRGANRYGPSPKPLAPVSTPVSSAGRGSR